MDFRCPECGDDESNYGVKLKFSICGHHVCEKCFKKLFRNNLEVKCPNCERSLKINDFAYKYKEDYDAENDREIRRQVLSTYFFLSFNRTLEDFSCREDFDDYLELIEDLVEDMLKGQNTEKVQESLEAEKETRKTHIQKAEIRKEKALKELYNQAILSDFMYNDRWFEQVQRLCQTNEEEARVEEEVFVMKEMPAKVDDLVEVIQNLHLEAMTEDLKRLVLDANGFDHQEIQKTCTSELIEGLG